MAPRGAAGKEKANVEEDEQVLQAVIIADSFNKRFKPLTVNRPRVRHAFFRDILLIIRFIIVSFTYMQCYTTRLDVRELGTSRRTGNLRSLSISCGEN